jgi:TetR/AcrR family transcriptional regulator, transcriptional repressor of aconitase
VAGVGAFPCLKPAAFLGELNNPKQRMRRRVTVQLWAEGQHTSKLQKVARDTFAKPYKLLRDLFMEGRRRGDSSKQIDADGMARFLIATFHGLVLQRNGMRDWSLSRNWTSSIFF